MTNAQSIINSFTTVLKEPWGTPRSGPEKVWFLVFPPSLILQMESRIQEIQNRVLETKMEWAEISVEYIFAEWITNHKYAKSYFEKPEYVNDQIRQDFIPHLHSVLISKLTEVSTTNSIFCLHSVHSLFGWVKLSDVLSNSVTNAVKGRLLVLFPGEFSNNNYRMMGSRDGWSYLARPIF